MKFNRGSFIISLDFELMWGVRDKRSIETYGNAIKNVHIIIPRLLQLFEKYEIKATFSTVGFLFAEDRIELQDYFPNLKPTYEREHLNPYSEFDNLKSEYNDYYFAKNIIKAIKHKTEHEISTHTFSHFYCNEPGQTIDQFDEDLKAAIKIAERDRIALRSIVFPRNQVKPEYLEICLLNGISVYRGNDDTGFYNTGTSVLKSNYNKIMRFLDTYLPLSGHNSFDIEKKKELINVKASRFLRPYSSKLSFLEKFKINRIKKSMTFAAKNNLNYHLWWHPHNFGSNMEENFKNLELILKHYLYLKEKYNFQSSTMESFIALKS